MRILKHLTMNEEILTNFPFKRELSMEAYLIENTQVLNLGFTPFTDVDVVGDELHIQGGGSKEGRNGRLDLVVSYGQETLGVVELKLGEVVERHLEQLEAYLAKKETILSKLKKDYEASVETGEALEIFENPKWIGLLVGSSICPDLRKKIENGYVIHQNIPLAALTIQRFRSEQGNVFIVTDLIFQPPKKATRDYSKWEFFDNVYQKGQLVLAVVKKFVEDNPEISFSDLKKVFPDHLQSGSEHKKGEVFCSAKDGVKRYEETGNKYKRHHLNPEDHIKLSDATIVVSNQWGIDNIDNILRKANELGYEWKLRK